MTRHDRKARPLFYAIRNRSRYWDATLRDWRDEDFATEYTDLEEAEADMAALIAAGEPGVWLNEYRKYGE